MASTSLSVLPGSRIADPGPSVRGPGALKPPPDRDYGVSSSGPSRVAACLPGRRTLPLLEATDEDWYQV